ncbi:MAG: GNAT family N-acetyltransferase [Gemmatimonadetes bacterium]|nr:MAG: GNAT family N-acetyltransferase [Gemmatimonadota bacterium]PYP50810.1 MAG: GNAT family N-acetyltransferase [Gemmatimonadota bacterium]
MTSPGEVRIDNEVSEADEAAVVRGLLTFNEKWLGPSNDQPVRFVARDELGVVGGLLGHTRWNWLYVAKLWVDARARGRGIGTQLLMGAEELARKRGCTDASLDTFEYQARPFYEKLGYELFGTLDGYPPGYRQFYLRKRLQPPTD